MSDVIEDIEVGGLTEGAMLQWLAEELAYPAPQDGDISPADLADKTGFSKRWCYDLLDEGVKNGTYVPVEVVEPGRKPHRVYRPIENDSPRSWMHQGARLAERQVLDIGGAKWRVRRVNDLTGAIVLVPEGRP